MKVFTLLSDIAIKIGPLSIHWYGVIIACGVLLAVFLGMREAEKLHINGDAIIDMMLWALPIALVGARLYYVIFEWPYYQENPGEIIKIWHGGIAIYGGLIAGGIVVYFFTKKKNIPVWLMLDIAAPAVMIAQAIGRWGNFVNHEAFGGETTLTFLTNLHLPQFIIQNMFIDGAYRQPTFLYESMWNLIGFIIIMLIRHRKGWFKQGEIALSYVMWYAFGRFFVEGMRTDSLMFLGLRVSQILSVILFVGALALIIYRRKKYPENPDYLAGNQLKGVYYKA